MNLRDNAAGYDAREVAGAPALSVRSQTGAIVSQLICNNMQHRFQNSQPVTFGATDYGIRTGCQLHAAPRRRRIDPKRVSAFRNDYRICSRSFSLKPTFLARGADITLQILRKHLVFAVQNVRYFIFSLYIYCCFFIIYIIL